MRNTTKTILIDLCWLALLLSGFYFLFLNLPALTTPDEARYAEIPREMLAMHQYIVPHLNGVIYFEKPPLAYWIVAGFEKLFGFSELAVRSPVAILSILTCLATYATARKLFNRRTGILSALVLASSLLFFVMGHFNTTDMPLTFCLTLCLYSFLIALRGTKPKTKWLLIGYVFSGLAMMAKGLIGIAFPALTLLIYLGLTKRWQLLKQVRLISGLLIIVAINLPWLWLAQKQVPSFLYDYFYVQQFLRYSTDYSNRHMGLPLYTVITLFSLFPWSVYLPVAIKTVLKHIKEKVAAHNTLRLLIIWPAFIVGFFACSNSVLVPYLLPITPALAIITGYFFDQASLNKQYNLLKQGTILGIFNLFMAFGFAIYLFASHNWHAVFIALDIAFIISGLLILGNLKNTKRIFVATLISAVFILPSIWLTACVFNHRSIKPLALTINKLMKKTPNALIVNYGFYRQDLPYYTKQLVYVVSGFGELTYGIKHAKNKTRFIKTDNDFRALWHSNKRLYVIFARRDYKGFKKHMPWKMWIIQRNKNHLLVTNKALA